MREEGFARIIFILAVLIISAGIIGGVFYIKRNVISRETVITREFGTRYQANSSVGSITAVLYLEENKSNFSETIRNIVNSFEEVLKNREAKDYVTSFTTDGWGIEISDFVLSYYKGLHSSDIREFGKELNTYDVKFYKVYESITFKYPTYLTSYHLYSDEGAVNGKHIEVRTHTDEKSQNLDKVIMVISSQFGRELSTIPEKIVYISNVPAGFIGASFYYNAHEYQEIRIGKDYNIFYTEKAKDLII